MLDPATARLCVWRLPLEAAFRLFSKLGSLGGSIRERFSRTGRTRPALARPAFSRWLENDRLRERWPCQWLNVLYFPFSETSPNCPWGSGASPLTRHKKTRSVISCVALLTGKFRRKFRSKSVCALLSANARGKKWTRSGRITQLAQRHLN